MKLSQCVEAMGFKLVICKWPGRRKDKIGHPPVNGYEAALTGKRIGCRADDWEYAYGVSHEMSEAIHGFQDHESVFCMQANILSAWHMMRSGQKHGLAAMMACICKNGHDQVDTNKKRRR